MIQNRVTALLLFLTVFSTTAFGQSTKVAPSIRSLFTRGEGQVVPSKSVIAQRPNRIAANAIDGINAPVNELQLTELPAPSQTQRAEFISNAPALKESQIPAVSETMTPLKPSLQKPWWQNKPSPTKTPPLSPAVDPAAPTAAPTAAPEGAVGCLGGAEGCSGCGGTGGTCNCVRPSRRLLGGLRNDVPCRYESPIMVGQGRIGRIGEMTRRFRERRLIIRQARLERRLANLGSRCPGCGIGASSGAGRIVGTGVGAVGYGMHSFGCGFSEGVHRYDHCYSTCGCCGESRGGCRGGNGDRGSYGRGIIAACKAIRGGAGRPYGDMPQHHPYQTWRNYYYYRPYNAVHYRDHQDCSSSMGFGTQSQPYTGDAFERAYEETLQGTQRSDKRYLEYSSNGGETLFDGHERYEQPQTTETFFPEQVPVDIEWEDNSIPTEIPLPALNSEEDSRPLSLEPEPSPVESGGLLQFDAVGTEEDASVPPAFIPDKPTDPAAIETPLFRNGSADSSKDAATDDKAIENLIDKLLPVEDPNTSP